MIERESTEERKGTFFFFFPYNFTPRKAIKLLRGKGVIECEII